MSEVWDGGGQRAATGSDQLAELARLGSATVYEAGGRGGFVDAQLVQVIPGSAVAGPARTALCAQDDNLMVHAVMPELKPGEVLVLAMPEPRPVALLGELLATQAQAAGAAAVLVDAAIRDLEQLRRLALPIWARHVRVRGAVKRTPGALNVPLTVGGALINLGDVLVLDADGVAVIARDRVGKVLEASRAREQHERVTRRKLEAGQHTYELDGLRAIAERGR